MPLIALAGLFLASLLIAWTVTGWLVSHLGRRGLLDHPNERSSHVTPTPRGGGLGIWAAVFPIWAALLFWGDWDHRGEGSLLLLALFMLAALSWRDDRKSLPWSLRLGVQLVCVAIVLAVMLGRASQESGWPALILLIAGPGLAFCWLWVVNLFNFMDGIDGIVGSEIACFAAGTALCLALAGAPIALIGLAITLCAASLGFLRWNWPPARIFMGDVGSIPLGFLVGFLMLELALAGLWGAALALPSVFLADATLTLLSRWRRGAKLTEAHRTHFYQRAAGRDRARHRLVVLRILMADAALIVIAASGARMPGPAGQVMTVLLAIPVVVGLLGVLQRMARTAPA